MSTTTRQNTKVETKVITMSIENIESAIASFLYATRTIPESWEVTYMDLGLELNEDGFVEFEIEVARPVKRDLRVVDNSYIPQDNEKQMTLPFETFEKLHVKDL
jgi:hypothetical protein